MLRLVNRYLPYFTFFMNTPTGQSTYKPNGSSEAVWRKKFVWGGMLLNHVLTVLNSQAPYVRASDTDISYQTKSTDNLLRCHF